MLAAGRSMRRIPKNGHGKIHVAVFGELLPAEVQTLEDLLIAFLAVVLEVV